VEDGKRLTAGIVPLVNGKVVLISNRKDSAKWGLPKGGWEDWELNAADAAAREGFEEAGVRGISGASLESAEVTSKNGGHAVKIHWFVCYVTELADNWPEDQQRNRIVVEIKEAIGMVHRPEHKRALEEVLDRSLDQIRVTCRGKEQGSQWLEPTLAHFLVATMVVAVTVCFTSFPGVIAVRSRK